MIPTKVDLEKLEYLMYSRSLEEPVDLSSIQKVRELSLRQLKKLTTTLK